MMRRQTTLAKSVSCAGKGVHSGDPCVVQLHPGDANTGYQFVRCDVDKARRDIPGRFDSVGYTLLGTNLTNQAGVSVATVEHVLSALAGMGVDNAVIEVDAAEMPIMDGSAAPFVALIEEAGTIELAAARRFLKIIEPVEIAENGKCARFEPSDHWHISFEIDFPSPVIGRQSLSLDLTPSSYAKEIAAARTFGFLHEAEQLQAAGRALGAGLDNTIVIDGDKILNDEPLRFQPDEFVRHKILDAVGDLSLIGGQILGRFSAVKSGHNLNNRALRALFDRPAAFEWVT